MCRVRKGPSRNAVAWSAVASAWRALSSPSSAVPPPPSASAVGLDPRGVGGVLPWWLGAVRSGEFRPCALWPCGQPRGPGRVPARNPPSRSRRGGGGLCATMVRRGASNV